MSELEKDVRKHYALPPYNNSTNYVAFDNYHWKYIENKYTKEEINLMLKKLGVC